MTSASLWIDAYIGMGSNLDHPVEQLNSAYRQVAALPEVEAIALSPFYGSRPIGPQDQPDYTNAVMHIKTRLAAIDLLTAMQQIENDHGRVRAERWGARTLDLDLLLYGEQIINHPRLQVPHQEMCNRGFVLYPLADIADPELIIPGRGRLQQLLSNCSADGLKRLST